MNLNKLFVSESEDEAVDYLVSKANLYFDKGELSKAEGYANKAYAINPMDEDVAIVKGYINLSQAGVGIFELSRKLISLSDGDEEEQTASLHEFNQKFRLNAEDSSNSASDFLDKLSTLITDKTEIEKLSGEKVVGAGLFSGLDYSPPLTTDAARQVKTNLMEKIDSAVRVICPYVNTDAKILGLASGEVADPRHSAINCPESQYQTTYPAQAHFIWALSHLIEATAFNLVIVPVLGTLEAQTKKASSPPGTDVGGSSLTIADSLSAFSSLADTVGSVLPTGDGSDNSMLIGMLNDLDSSAKGFGQIAGIPKELITKLSESIASFRSSQEKFQDSGKYQGASSLKDQLVSNIGKSMKKYIEDQDSSLSSSEKDSACSSIEDVSKTEYDALVASGKCN